MSAYIVDRALIAFLVDAGLEIAQDCGGSPLRWRFSPEPAAGVERSLRQGDYEQAAQVGQMLWDENIKSVGYRYPGEDKYGLPGPSHESFDYMIHQLYNPGGTPTDPGRVFQSLNEYECQTCEHPEWEQSEAFAYCDALRRAWCHRVPATQARVGSWA